MEALEIFSDLLWLLKMHLWCELCTPFPIFGQPPLSPYPTYIWYGVLRLIFCALPDDIGWLVSGLSGFSYETKVCFRPFSPYIEWLWTNKWSTVQMNASVISYLFPKHQAYWRRKRKQTREMRETREIGACRQHWRLNICRYIGWVDKYSIRSQDPNDSSDRSFTRETWLTLKLDWHYKRSFCNFSAIW